MTSKDASGRNDLRRRAERLFHEAADLRSEARARFVEQQCAGNDALRDTVQRLLVAFEQMGEFLEEPAVGEVAEESDDDEPHPSSIGSYEIVRVVGVGGMGVVYEARQEQPHRRVALKVIHPALVSRRWLKRFEREGEILGRLHHAAIAHVYEAGFAEVVVPGRVPVRQPFLAMEYVDGRPLTEYAKQQSLNTRRRLDLVARICDAVQHAHEQGVVHRDLKPSNILVDAKGGPKVLDFGVARATGADWKSLTTATASGYLIGTVSYGSPEQIGGAPSEIDARSDVYSLGAVLYELLSGRLPIDVRDRSLPEMMRAVREDEPSRLSSFDSAFRGDIDAIVGKALSKERERRYATAGEMAADIRRFLRSRPIRARPPSTLYQMRKFTRRNKILVGGVVATIVALAIGLIVSTTFARREARQRRVAEASSEQTERALVEARLDEAVALIAVRDFNGAARSLDAVPEERRGWEWNHLKWRASQYLAEIPVPEGGLTGVTVARRAPLLFIAGGDGMVRVRDLATAKIVKEFATGHRWTGQLAAHPEGALLLGVISSRRPRAPLAAPGRHLVAWEVDSGRELWRRPAAPSVGLDAFSPDGSLVAVGLWDRREILLLDARTGEVREELTVPDSVAQQPNFGPRGQRLVYHHGDASGVVDRRTGRTIRLPGIALPRFTDDGNVVACVRETRPKAILMRLDTGETTGLPRTHSVTPLVAPGGKRFLVADENGTAVLRLDALDDAYPLGGKDSVLPYAWSADGTRLVTRQVDGRIRIWDAATDTRPLRIMTHGRASAESHSVYGNWNEAVALSPDGQHLATAGWRFVTLHSLSDGSEIWNTYRLEPFPTALAFSPDGLWLAVAGQDGSVTIVDAASGATDRVLSRPGGQLAGLVWSRDGDRLVVATAEGRIRILDVRSGEPVGELEGPSGEIRCFARSPDGTRVAAGGQFASRDAAVGTGDMLPGVVVWEVSNGDTLGVFRTETRPVDAVAFDAGGQRIAAVTSAGELAVWNVTSKERLASAVHNPVALQSVAFAPDGERIVTGGVDGKLQFWDTQTYEHKVALETGLFNDSFVAFFPNGSTVVAVGGDGLILLETGPPSVGFAARARAHEARHVVNRLYNELDFAEDVIKRLRAAPNLSEDVRAEALELVRIRGDHIGWLNSDATLGYRTTELSPESQQLILRKIELVNRLWPDHPEYVANLAKCQYRAGRYREALENLQRSADLYQAASRERQPEDWAFVAMARWRLGEREAAFEALRRLDSLMTGPGNNDEPWHRLFYEEAESLLER